MTRFTAISVVVVLWGAILAGTCFGEVFVLEHGGRVEGELLNPEQASRTGYIVQTAGGKILLQPAQVAEVIAKSEAEIAYERLLAEAAPATVEAHWRMAEWCREQRLEEARNAHLNAIIRLDPNHKDARLALGYTTVDDRWVIHDEWKKGQGFVRNFRGWRLGIEDALEKQREVREDAVDDWRKKVRMWRGWLDGRRAELGLQELRNVDDIRAAPAIIDLLNDEPNRDVRLLYVEILGKMRGGAATQALVERLLYDPDAAVRDRCLALLQEDRRRFAVSRLASRLSENDNRVVNRAGVALGSLKAESAIPELIDALTTKHRQVTGRASGGSPIGASFGNGGTGLNAGGGPKVIERTLTNQGVLQALILLTGVNHSFNKEAWRRWYERENTPQDVNLRRDG